MRACPPPHSNDELTAALFRLPRLARRQPEAEAADAGRAEGAGQAHRRQRERPEATRTAWSARTSFLAFVVATFLAACGAPPPGRDVVEDAGAPPADAGPFDTGDEDGDYDGGGDPGSDAGTDAPDEDAGAPADAGAAPPEVTVVEQTLRVLHWNIAGGKENDCRTDLIARAVRRLAVAQRADFVGLNEVCPAQHDAIREALRVAWGLGPGAVFSAYQGDNVPRVVGNAIYSRRGLSDVLRQKLGRDQYGDRFLLCGRVPAQPHLRFCSAHLSVGDAVASAQVSTALSRLETWWTQGGDTVFLSGDLNLAANHPGLDAVYSDTVDTPHNRNNTGRYHELDDDDAGNCPGYGERSTPGVTGGPCGTGGKIDFIFVRRDRVVGADYADDTLDIPDDCTGACSDHRPVTGYARLRIRQD